MRYADTERLIWMRSLIAQEGAITALREKAGLSQQDVAVAVGVTPGAVGRWERGTRIPRGPKALVYARLLDRIQRQVGP